MTGEDEVASVAWRVAMRVAALGVKASDVAEACGMTAGGLSAIIGGDNPTLRSLERIEIALGVERGWLVKTATREVLAVEAAGVDPPEWLLGSSRAGAET